MEIKFSKEFEKSYSKRILGRSALESRFFERFKIFKENRRSPILRDHGLIGEMEGSRSFAVNGDIRVVYHVEDEGTIIFLDIGSHNQVY